MWIFFLLPLLAAAAPPTRHNVLIGQVFNLTVGAGSRAENRPEWLALRNGQLFGIPTDEDLGTHSIQLRSRGSTDRTVEIRVEEDTTNPCGDQDTTWVEVIYTIDATVEKRVEAASKVASTLGVGMDAIRVLDFDYSRKFRMVEEIAKAEDGAFVVIKPFCDGEVEAMDLATDDMDKLLDDDDDTESEFDVTITKGRVLGKKTEKQEESPVTSAPKTTTQRTTRQVIDNPPVRLNSLSGFSCTSGVLCESVVPEMTFKDAEEGDTYKLQLSITLLEGSDNFLFFKDRKIQGVPLKAGEYQFRLDARDRKGQMASAPFSVTVRPASPHNHLVTFQLDLNESQDMISNPQLLTEFVRQLALVTKGRGEQIAIRSVQKKEKKTIVTWSNNTLPYKTCSEDGIEAMMGAMTIKHRKTLSRQFEKAMTSRFNLRKVEHSLLDNCLREDTAGSTPATVEATRESTFPWIVLVAALAVFLLLLVCLVVLCSKKKTKKGSKPSEYVGKGHPVVFPEEVVDDNELAHATTPMLTKEERPPLKVSQHENPLYRPPPPLATASPRIGSAVGSLPPTQRMPPPYVPP